MRNDWDKEIAPWLSAEELEHVSSKVNPATHLLKQHGLQLVELKRTEALNLFHQIELMGLVSQFYAHQGKCERIKHTPFPRQYAEYSRLFTRIFVLLVPFGMLDVFGKQDAAFGENLGAMLAMISASTLVSWVFATMEGLGDASEDPFERSMNDVPMNAICRTIERDLQQMVGASELSPAEPTADGLLY